MKLPFLRVSALSIVLAGASSPAEEPRPAFRFANVAAEAGLDIEMVHGGPKKEWIFEANGSGAAVFDYDDDSLMDILIVNGSTLPHLKSIVGDGGLERPSPGVRLYRNAGSFSFTDVTSNVGLQFSDWATGANAADYDNDGRIDILITGIGRDALFRNSGSAGFEDISGEAGLSREIAWHTGSAFGDYDNDGDLDLYVAGYVAVKRLWLESEAPICDYRGLEVFCGPLGLEAEPDILYRNEGDGTFQIATSTAGVEISPPRHGFVPVFEDFDGDGDLDLFVSNDSDPNSYFVNIGDGRFDESGLVRGVAYDANGQAQADMGVAVADYDADGDFDILTTTFSEDHFPLFQQAEGSFEDTSYRTGLARATMRLLGWACGFTDLDNDGRLDLWVANGHVYPTIDQLRTTTYVQPFTFFKIGHGAFSISPSDVIGFPQRSNRAAVTGDFDNDGRIDLLVLPIEGEPALLQNRSEHPHSWIGFRLRGDSNVEAIGVRIEIEACGRTQWTAIRNGGGYVSRSDLRPHFGLGNCSSVDRVTVSWPGGGRQTLEQLKVNQWVTIHEP